MTVISFNYIGSAEKVLVPNNYASNVIFIFEMFLNLNKNTNFAVDTVLQGFDLCRYTFGFTCQDEKFTPQKQRFVRQSSGFGVVLDFQIQRVRAKSEPEIRGFIKLCSYIQTLSTYSADPIYVCAFSITCLSAGRTAENASQLSV